MRCQCEGAHRAESEHTLQNYCEKLNAFTLSLTVCWLTLAFTLSLTVCWLALARFLNHAEPWTAVPIGINGMCWVTSLTSRDHSWTTALLSCGLRECESDVDSLCQAVASS